MYKADGMMGALVTAPSLAFGKLPVTGTPSCGISMARVDGSRLLSLHLASKWPRALGPAMSQRDGPGGRRWQEKAELRV